MAAVSAAAVAAENKQTAADSNHWQIRLYKRHVTACCLRVHVVQYFAKLTFVCPSVHQSTADVADRVAVTAWSFSLRIVISCTRYQYWEPASVTWYMGYSMSPCSAAVTICDGEAKTREREWMFAPPLTSHHVHVVVWDWFPLSRRTGRLIGENDNDVHYIQYAFDSGTQWVPKGV
jgi:hypothetical protein